MSDKFAGKRIAEPSESTIVEVEHCQPRRRHLEHDQPLHLRCCPKNIQVNDKIEHEAQSGTAGRRISSPARFQFSELDRVPKVQKNGRTNEGR